jgi:hypothetical protein
LERPEGHLVVQIASQSAATTVVDGANNVGYANYIIIRSRMSDPLKGGTAPDTYGKLDGTAKGGVAIAVVQQLGLPIRFIGAGEGIEDLRPFSSYEFVEALLSN